MFKVLYTTLNYVNLIGDRCSEKTFWFAEMGSISLSREKSVSHKVKKYIYTFVYDFFESDW